MIPTLAGCGPPLSGSRVCATKSPSGRERTVVGIRYRTTIEAMAWRTLVPGIALMLSAAALASPLRAQTGTVEGVVFDSLARRPLPAALVQIVAAPPGHEAYSATADSLGRFRVEGVRPGSYIAGFLHPLLDSLGLVAPYRAVTVAAGETASLPLAIPGAASLARAICAPVQDPRTDPASRTTGTLVGRVIDETNRQPVAGSLVAAVWSELVVDARGVRRESRQVHGKTNADGWFAMCDLEGGDYRLRAERGKRATGFLDVAVGASEVDHVSLALGADSDSAAAADSTPRSGGATVAGVVRNSSGHPVEGAQVVVEGLGASTTTNASGAFSLSGLPDGSRMAEARALGYAPARTAVEPSRGETRSVTIVMDKQVKTLAAVTVYGKSGARLRDLTGFAQRRQEGFGRFVTHADIDKQGVFTTCDLFRRIVGLHVVDGGIYGCEVSMRGAASMMRPRGAGGACQPTVYLDNMQFQGTVGELAQTITPQQIMGMEVYSTATEPPEYPGACGTIVVWTLQ